MIKVKFTITMKKLLPFICLFFGTATIAQIEDRKDVKFDSLTTIEEGEITEEDEIFEFIEEQAQFPGGDRELYKFLNSKVKYPQLALDSGIKGTVYVTFIVEKDGSITDIKVARGIGGGCDEEAVRVVRSMPRWKPGKQKGEFVRVKYTLPFQFNFK